MPAVGWPIQLRTSRADRWGRRQALVRNDLDWTEHRRILDGGEAGSWSGRLLSGRQRPLVGDGAAHAQRGVLAGGVVVLDPGRDLGPGMGFGGEVLHAPQLPFQ